MAPRVLWACCCALGSAFFTVFFHQSTYLINSRLDLELPTDLLEQLTNEARGVLAVVG